MFSDRTNHARLAEQTNARFTAHEKQRANANLGASRYACGPSTGEEVATGLPPKGHNNPPGPLESAQEALAELNAYLLDNPVIQDHKQAKEAGGWIERTRISLKQIEDERTEKVGPINALLKNINDTYRTVREPLEKVLLELKRRRDKYLTAEEDRRRAEAERLRALAEAQKIAAQQAAQAADEAIANADVGECADVGGAIADADAAIKAAGRSDRAAARAERESVVRVGSVMGGKAQSLRNYEVLTITDVAAALKCMGMTDHIREAILTSARVYRKEFGELPVGIKSETERRS